MKMIFNWNYGMEMGLTLVSKTYAGIDSAHSLEMPLTLNPVAILLRTSAGEDAELCVYCRADLDDAYTLRSSAGSAALHTRLEQELETHLVLSCTGATADLPASVECTILGVKK